MPSPRASAAALLAAFTRVFKSEELADILDTPDAADLWSAGTPAGRVSQREIAAGPSQEMSGAGASGMTKEYSTPGRATISTDLATRLGALLDEIRSLSAVPGASTETYLGKCNTMLRQAKSSILKAGIADGEARTAAINDAAGLLVKAREALEDAANDADEAEDEDGIEKATKRFRALASKVAAMTETGTAKAGNPFNVPAGLPVRDLMTALTNMPAHPPMGAAKNPLSPLGKSSTIANPPDFHVQKSVTSIEQRVDEAIENNQLSPAEIDQALSGLQHMALAKSGRVPSDMFLHSFGSATQRVRDLFGVSVTPARATMN